MNASSGRDATSVSASLERREHVGINAPFENASENSNILRVSILNDETRQNIPDEVSELSVPETRFDRQPHTHHKNQKPIRFNCYIKFIGKLITRNFWRKPDQLA